MVNIVLTRDCCHGRLVVCRAEVGANDPDMTRRPPAHDLVMRARPGYQSRSRLTGIAVCDPINRVNLLYFIDVDRIH